MKKWISCFLCAVIVFTLTGCGDATSAVKTGKQPAGVNDVLEAGMAEQGSESDTGTQSEAIVVDNADSEQTENNDSGQESNTDSEQIDNVSSEQSESVKMFNPESTIEPAFADPAAGGNDGIDVDLTSLSSTMVYSEVYNMMVSPMDYIGKTVRMDGLFALYYDETTGNNYYACIIKDATACCSQGIEFVLKDHYAYPDDYPEEGGEICVVGVFDTYQEGEYSYCTLRDAEIVSG